jgi:hypothetical protein
MLERCGSRKVGRLARSVAADLGRAGERHQLIRGIFAAGDAPGTFLQRTPRPCLDILSSVFTGESDDNAQPRHTARL